MKSPELPTLKPVEQSPSLEKNQNIIEAAKKKRRDLVIGIMKRFADHGLDLWPILGNVSIAGKIYAGETIVGDKLTPRDRVVYSIIIILNILFYILLGEKELEAGAKSWFVSAGLTSIQKYIELKRNIKKLQQMAEENKMKSLAESLPACVDVLDKYGEENIVELLEKVEKEKNENK